MGRKKLIPLPKLKKKAWTLFSRYIRSKDADFQDYAECYTCRKKFPWQELDAGHFMHGKLDFDPLNVRPQCTRCNRFLHGNLGEYALRLIKDYGRKKIDAMRKRAEHRYDRKELEKIISDLS